MEFKHNISRCCSTLMFTDICKDADENAEKYPYVKHESLE